MAPEIARKIADAQAPLRVSGVRERVKFSRDRFLELLAERLVAREELLRGDILNEVEREELRGLDVDFPGREPARRRVAVERVADSRLTAENVGQELQRGKVLGFDCDRLAQNDLGFGKPVRSAQHARLVVQSADVV